MKNPIPEILDDATFIKLAENCMIDQVAVRNYRIRQLYNTYRRQGMCMYDSLEMISLQFPLSLDYLRIIATSRRTTRKAFCLKL